MKKTMIAVLAVLILFSGTGCPAFAGGGFDVPALQSSSSFEQRGDYWSVAGEFSGMADGAGEAVTVGAYLSRTYVSEGWGPELRISLKKNAGNVFCEVTAFRATVNGVCFKASDGRQCNYGLSYCKCPSGSKTPLCVYADMDVPW